MITLVIGVITIMGCSIWSASMLTANAQSNYTIKVAKTTEDNFITNVATNVVVVLFILS